MEAGNHEGLDLFPTGQPVYRFGEDIDFGPHGVVLTGDQKAMVEVDMSIELDGDGEMVLSEDLRERERRNREKNPPTSAKPFKGRVIFPRRRNQRR